MAKNYMSHAIFQRGGEIGRHSGRTKALDRGEGMRVLRAYYRKATVVDRYKLGKRP